MTLVRVTADMSESQRQLVQDEAREQRQRRILEDQKETDKLFSDVRWGRGGGGCGSTPLTTVGGGMRKSVVAQKHVVRSPFPFISYATPCAML